MIKWLRSNMPTVKRVRRVSLILVAGVLALTLFVSLYRYMWQLGTPYEGAESMVDNVPDLTESEVISPDTESETTANDKSADPPRGTNTRAAGTSTEPTAEQSQTPAPPQEQSATNSEPEEQPLLCLIGVCSL